MTAKINLPYDKSYFQWPISVVYRHVLCIYTITRCLTCVTVELFTALVHRHLYTRAILHAAIPSTAVLH